MDEISVPNTAIICIQLKHWWRYAQIKSKPIFPLDWALIRQVEREKYLDMMFYLNAKMPTSVRPLVDLLVTLCFFSAFMGVTALDQILDKLILSVPPPTCPCLQERSFQLKWLKIKIFVYCSYSLLFNVEMSFVIYSVEMDETKQ